MNNDSRKLLPDQVENWIVSELRTRSQALEAEWAASVARGKKKDWLWRGLLLSMATYGRSAGAENLFVNKEEKLPDELEFECLANISNEHCKRMLEAQFRRINARYLNRKIDCLANAIDRIKNEGGLARVQQKARSLTTAQEKIAFFRNSKFRGIGPKYARNIWMDIADEHVIESIAIDSRIKKLVDCLGWTNLTYQEQEQNILGLGKQCGVNGWKLDRLLYSGLTRGGTLEALLQQRTSKKGLSAGDSD